MGIAVLGPLRVDGDCTSLGPRDRVVLEALAVGPGDVVSAERLADALWADGVPTTWPKVVQGCVVRLRKVLGAEAIETSPQGYRLAFPADDIDAGRFERLVRRSHELLVLGEHERAAYVSGEALALWRGRPFSELDGWEPGRIEACRLEELRLDAEEVRVDAALRAGRHRDVLGEAEARAAEAPLRERRWALLAVAQYQAGRQGDALRSLRQARRILVADLGVEPGPELVALEQAILRQDPSLAAAVALPEANATCPYRGLLAYDVGDADTYYGRDDDVTVGLSRLAGVGALAVVGPSGGGKSSLVRAGIAATLQRQGRQVKVFSPGTHPEQSLISLGTLPAGTVLVIDQCEEAFTLCDDAAARTRFLDALVAHAARGPLVVALRADRLGDLAAHPAFARLVEQSLHLLGAMDDAALRAAIEAPARQYGLLLEAGLVDVLVGEVEGEPGALPLLSHALRETWVRRQGRTLTVEGYRASGGIRSAVAQSAERVYEQIDPAQRPLLRDLMLRLVTPTPDGDPVRGRIARLVVATDVEHERLIETLVAARLVTSDERMVELAHESIVRAWPRLRDWLDDDVEGQRILRHLAAAGEAWDAMGRPDTELYRGQRLAQAVEWRDRASPDLNLVERQYLAAPEATADRERLAAEDRARHQVRVNRKLRTLLVGVGAVLVVAIVAGLLALRQADRADRTAELAEREAERADAAGTLAEARRLGTQALLEGDYDRALLLAVEGRHLEDSRETRRNLLTTVQRSPDAIAIIRSETEAFIDVALSPDGETIIASGRGVPSSMTRYDVTTRKPDASISGISPSVSSTVAPDGRHAVMTYHTGTLAAGRTFGLHIVDLASFEIIDTLPGLFEAPPTRLSFSPDGRYIAAVTDSDLSGAGVFEALALVWDIANGGEPVVRYRFSAPNFQRDTAFLPDSKRILVAGADGTAIVDIASGTNVGQIDGAHPPIAVSRDGRTLAAATDMSPGVVIGVFDLPSGERTAVLAGHRERLVRLAFSPDGTNLASGADDRLVTLWDVVTGQRTDYEGHAAGVNALAFSPDGKTLWSGGDDRAVFAWDLQRSHSLVHRPSPDLADAPELSFVAQGMVIGPDGRDVAFPSTEQVPFQIRDVATGVLGRPTDEIFLSFSPDGDRYLTVDIEGRLRVWDRGTSAVVAVSEGSGFSDFHEGTSVFTPDGSRVVALRYDASGLNNDSLVVLDASTLAPIAGEPVPIGSAGRLVGVTPDGRHAVVVASAIGQPGTNVLLADLETGRIVRSTPVEPVIGARNNTVAPDGRTVGIGGVRGDVVLVDAVTGDVSPVLHAHDGFVESITFAPDYASFVTTGQDGAVRLWDGATQQLLGTVLPFGANHRVRASFLAADRVLIVDDNGEIVEWDPRPDTWEAYACKVAGRNLTETEWAELFPGQAYRATCPDYPAGA